MAYHFYLPQLSGENISVPKELAHWNNNDKKIILGISEAIAIDEQALTKGVSSIPDIWARPLLFQSAIKSGSNHPLKKRCIQEWRGLLALLALHKVKPELSDLEVVSVSLNNERFSTALKNLAPRPIQLQKDKTYSWTDVLMIRYKGVPVGAFSPSTLVYTAVDYNKKLLNVPFALRDKEGFLAPPVTKDAGLEYLGEWLYTLQKRLTAIFYSDQSNPDHQTVSTINQLLDSWIKEIRETLGLEENDPIDVKAFKVSEDPIEVKGDVPAFLSGYQIYQHLLHPLKKDENLKDEILISDILLRSARNQERRIAVITEKTLSQQINIWNELRPGSLGDNPKAIIERFFTSSSGTKIAGTDLSKDGGMWIRPELYFLSEKLLVAKEGTLLEENERELNIRTKFILPFKKEILEFFSPEEITLKLKPTYSQDGNLVRFSFLLPVGDTTIKIEKTYKTKATQKEDGEVFEIDVPIIEIFPNYLGKDWRKYFFFYNEAESYHILPLTPLPVDKRFKDVNNKEEERNVRIYELSGDNSFPEAVEISDENNSPLGVILIEKQEPKRQTLRNQWTIGIDFGTSNTNVYRNRGTADSAERWTYDFPSYYRNITANKSSLRNQILEEYFFPTRKVQLPIPTTLRMDSKARRSMVLDYFIYYPVEYKFPENVLSEIKWDSAGERKTEYFLESLLFLLLIEVVKEGVEEVSLACSYPKAFSQTNISIFQREWELVFDKLLKSNVDSERVLNIHSGSAADNEVKVIIKKPVFKTEGIAAGEYFANPLTIPRIEERANKEIAAICLDVGGGTTDISVWYLDKIEFDASVLLAGRQLSNLLQINSRVRELLFSKEAAIALEEKKNESPYFSARLNLILKNEEEQIRNMLVKHANNKDVQWLRQVIALEFGALAFFAAEVCVSTNDKVGGLLSRIASDGINLHWGGNAAKLINWIDFGIYNRNGIASKILNATFFKCLDDVELAERSIKAKALMQLQSPDHKSEAAGGLVVMELGVRSTETAVIAANMGEYDMPDDLNEPQSFYTGIVCGENIILSDKKVRFFDSISNKDLFDSNGTSKFQETTLNRLMKFVNVLNFFGIKYGLFNEDTKIVLGDQEQRLIRDGVRKEFIRMQSQSENQRLIEPVFITEVKLLLEIIKSKMN